MRPRKPKLKPRGRSFSPEAARLARLEGLRKARARKAAMLGLEDPGAARPAGDPLDYLLEETPSDRAWQARRMAAYLASPERKLAAERYAGWQAWDAAQRAKAEAEPEASASTPAIIGGHEQAPTPPSPSGDSAPAGSTLTAPKPKAPAGAGDGTPPDTCPTCNRAIPPGGIRAHMKLRPDCHPDLAQFAPYCAKGIDVQLHADSERCVATCMLCGSNAVIFLAGLDRFAQKHTQRHGG